MKMLEILSNRLAGSTAGLDVEMLALTLTDLGLKDGRSSLELGLIQCKRIKQISTY